MKAHHVLNAGAPVGCDRLQLVRFDYVDFRGSAHGDGELVVMDAIAERVLAIFQALQRRKFPIAQAKLMNAYDGDDGASMNDDNTSAFNHRAVTGGSTVSLHAYGVAIDLNPVQNPYLRRVNGTLTISPRSGAQFLNRKDIRPGMSEPVVDLFADNGLSGWGGFWTEPTDYQHFQVNRRLAQTLAHARPAAAAEMFERHIKRYLACLRRTDTPSQSIRRVCAAVD